MSETYQKILGALTHVIYLTGFGFFWIPLVMVFVANSTKSEHLEKHAKQAMVVQGILGLSVLIIGVLCYLFVGLLFLPVLAIIGVIYFFLSIYAAYRALLGNEYRYPIVGAIAEKI